MADDRTYFVQCMDGCLFESMTKEQILTAISQAVSSHEISDVDTGFVTKIKELNHNSELKFWVGTQAEYNAIATKAQGCFYIISDDTTESDIQTQLDTMQAEIDALVNNKVVDISNYVTINNVADVTTTVKAYANGKVVELYIDISDDVRETKQNFTIGTINSFIPKHNITLMISTYSYYRYIKITPDLTNGTATIMAEQTSVGGGGVGSYAGSYHVMYLAN